MELEVGRILKETVRNLGALDAHFLRRALHPRGEVHGITEETIPRHGLTDHARHRGARGKPHANEHLIAFLGPEGLDEVNRVDREVGDALGGERRGDRVRGSADHHVRVPMVSNLYT